MAERLDNRNKWPPAGRPSATQVRGLGEAGDARITKEEDGGGD